MFENSGDPARPFGGHYEAFDYDFVSWYASWSFRERISYLDWIIALRQAEVDTWKAAQDPRDWGSEFRISEHHERLESVQERRRLEMADQEALPSWTGSVAAHYHHYLDSPRWKRKRIRKLVSTQWRCETSGCGAPADECHHLSYDRLGFEENADLAALCVGHHQMAHGRRWSDPEVA